MIVGGMCNLRLYGTGICHLQLSDVVFFSSFFSVHAFLKYLSLISYR